MIAKAEEAGYTIRFVSGPDEIRLRKPGSSLNASGNPDVYASVFRQGHSWGWVEKNDPLGNIL
jgi:hypothetical protein